MEGRCHWVFYSPHGGQVSHDDIQCLNGLKWHAKVVPTKHPLQLLQVHLGHMLHANLRRRSIHISTRLHAGDTTTRSHRRDTKMMYEQIKVSWSSTSVPSRPRPSRPPSPPSPYPQGPSLIPITNALLTLKAPPSLPLPTLSLPWMPYPCRPHQVVWHSPQSEHK